MSKVKMIKDKRCRCCGLHQSNDPCVYEAPGGRVFYHSAFGVIESDPKADYGLRLWDLVDDDGVFLHEGRVDYVISSAYVSATFGREGNIPKETLEQIIEKLHIPFMS